MLQGGGRGVVFNWVKERGREKEEFDWELTGFIKWVGWCMMFGPR